MVSPSFRSPPVISTRVSAVDPKSTITGLRVWPSGTKTTRLPLTVRTVTGPYRVPRYNLYPAAELDGAAAPGFSQGQAIKIMEQLAAQTLPQGFSYEWTTLAFQQIRAGNTAVFVFMLAVVFVFLVLAAQFESLTLPLAVILIVPMCLVSAILGVLLRGQDNNLLTQVGFVVLIALAAKNAILIVEFAKARREEGTDRRAATLHACELRLRPIMMTSFAFILGVLPLVAAHGAGAEMRRTLGTAVFSGMLGVTMFGILLTPVFFFVIDRIAGMHVFSSGHLHLAGNLAIDALSLGFVRRPIRARLKRPLDRKTSVSANPQSEIPIPKSHVDSSGG